MFASEVNSFSVAPKNPQSFQRNVSKNVLTESRGMLGARWLVIASSYRSAVNSNSLAILLQGSGRFKKVPCLCTVRVRALCKSFIALTPKPIVERLVQEHS